MRLWLVAACAVSAFAIACGAARPLAPSTGPAAMTERPDELHAQIDELDRDIGARLGAGAMGAPTEADVAGARTVAMDDAAKVCTPPPTPSASCDDACRLGDAICDDARRICELAGQLPGDAWAQGKCDSGKASCERARQRCCDCR